MDHDCIQKHTIEQIEEQLKETKILTLQIPLLIQRIDNFLENQKEIKDELEYQKSTNCTKEEHDKLDKKLDDFIDKKTIFGMLGAITMAGIIFQAGYAWNQIESLLVFKDTFQKTAYAQNK